MDLRHLIFVDQVGVRRLGALVRNLPPDAAVWRQTSFAPTEELLATMIERSDAWSNALLQAACQTGEKISVPGIISIPRPGTRAADGKVPTTDVREIARWFSSVN